MQFETSELILRDHDYDLPFLQKIENNEHEQKKDACLKMKGVYDLVNSLVKNKKIPKHFSLLDVGSGLSHVPALIKQTLRAGYVKAIDNVQVWPHNEIYEVDSEICDFYSYKDDKKYDVITDCCAIHEFNGDWDDSCSNLGFREGLNLIYDLLKPEGYFVCVSDCLHKNLRNSAGLIPPKQMVNIVKECGFETTQNWNKETSAYSYLSDIHCLLREDAPPWKVWKIFNGKKLSPPNKQAHIIIKILAKKQKNELK